MNNLENPFLLLPSRHNGIEKIAKNDILYLEGDLNYTIIHLVNGSKKVSSRTLGFHIQNSLNASFIRIHKAFCVNKTYILKGRNKYFFDTDQVELENGLLLNVARRRKKILQEIY